MLIKDHHTFILETIKNLQNIYLHCQFSFGTGTLLLINYNVLILGRLHELSPAVNVDKE